MTENHSQLSTLAEFDDIRRCMQVLMDGTAEEEFLKVMQLQEKFRLKCIATEQEAKRVQRELDASLQSMADLETKLFHARRLLEVETRARREAENERDLLERKIVAVADLLQHESNLRNETRDKLAFLHALPRKKKSMSRVLDERYNGGSNEINSTGSFLSDLSITHSDDDFLDIYSGVGGNSWHRKKRTSVLDNTNAISSKKKRLSAENAHVKTTGGRRSSRCRNRAANTEHRQLQQEQQPHLDVIEGGGAERICATTKVTIPQDGMGPIRAESTIETVPAVIPREHDEVTSDGKQKNVENDGDNVVMSVPSPKHIQEKQTLHSDSPNPQQQQLQPTRPHDFANKTFIRAETCVICYKKIRFGCMGLRCRNCSVRCHVECRSFVGVVCTPQINGMSQGGKGAGMGHISDYTPSFSPKIPPIILHCVNEIESRGMKEVGIYRVSGSEREVKALKERFLRNKNNLQQLSNIDIHVLCGCVKDFLRTLREPLIPTAMWKDFRNAVQNPTETDIKKYLMPVVENLPQANRDTLAFLMLHFQRIAECPEILMPLENIARIFGPTIVGNSTVDPDQHTIFTEVYTQYTVMLNLLKIPTEYWSQFIQIDFCNNQENRTANFYHNNNNNNDGGNQQQLLQTPTRDIYMLYASPSKSTSKKHKSYGISPYPKK